MKKGMMIAVVVMVMAVGAAYAGTVTVDVYIHVTPIVTEALTATPTYYNFGSLAVQTSSNSVTALTLENTGQIGITLEKSVQDDGAWDITLASTALNGFDLWVATSAVSARPALTGYTEATDRIDTYQTYSNLTGVSNTTQARLDPSATTGLWFRIDMPENVSTSDQQTITVRLRATGE